MVKITKRFSSLHNHSYYSLLDAVMSPEEVVQQAHDLGFNAVALTEHGNMFSYINGYKKAKELGIKYIAGCEVYETTDMNYKEKDADRYHLILLAKSKTGLKNLFKIVTEGYTRGFYTKPRVDLPTIAKYSEDIICMTACLGSRIDRLLYNGRCSCCNNKNEHKECNNFEPKWDEAKKWVKKYKEVFGDNFYIELQNHDTEAQAIANKRLLQLAEETNTKFTITFDTHLRDGSDLQKDVHSKFLKIGDGREAGETYEGCWQTDIETIHKVMDKQIGYENVEKAIDTTDEIANQCNLEIELHQDLMPHIKIPKEFKSEQDYLKHLVQKGWRERGFHKLPKEKKKIYKERLRKEFEVLDYLGYCSYFILLKQFINKVKERNIPLGYSRGSGANCLTLYTIGVTKVDSIKWDLDFSRFANKGRKGSAADYDIDISKRRRQEALEIAAELFGEEMISQVATFNSLSPNVCIRDLGKVFDNEGIYKLPYKERDKIAKLIPKDPNGNMTIEKALESSSELQQYAKKYPLLFEYTKYLQNIPKSVSCHAAAVLIAPTPIIEYSPLMYNENGNLMVQMDMYNAMDDLGLVKIDFLGLATLDVIDDTLKFAGLSWDDIDLNRLRLDDRNIFKNIYSKGKTLGVFQMESYVAQNMFKEMKPDNIEDVFAVNAMNRPAILSVGMDKVYIKNKHNPKEITYLHEDLKPIVEKTYGIMLYQEQQIKCFELAGFPEDRQDIARRAIGKKKGKVMKSLYDDFKDGLQKKNWDDKKIDELWNLIKAGAEYSFNRGHSTAYGLLSYITAWLKYYYPVEFMTALLISKIGDYEQTTKYINECHNMEIKVLPPDINKSDKYYTIDNKNILFGFESIKGVGEKATEEILKERENGNFKSFEDFYNRIKEKSSTVDSSTIISLIKSGAFGSNVDNILKKYCYLTFNEKEFKPVKKLPTKKELYKIGIIKTDEEFKDKETCLKKYNEYKRDIFEKQQKEKRKKHILDFKEKHMSTPEMYEYETLSIFLNGSPFDSLRDQITLVDDAEDGAIFITGGTITSVERKKQKNNKPYAYIELLTFGKMNEGMAFNTQYNKFQDLIFKGSNVMIKAKKSGSQFIVDKMMSLEKWKQIKGK